MAYEQKTNTGSLFKNDRKEQPNHADYRGTINIDGKDYWLNAWVKEAKTSGKKFFSLSVKEKGVNAPPRQPESTTAGSFDPNDDIPFGPRGSFE